MEFVFVEDPPEEYICQICLKVLCEPQLTDCCGQHFCHVCLEQWFESQGKNRCSHCRSEQLTHITDLPMKRKINQLKVYCSNRASGCKSVLRVEKLESHLSYSCGFVKLFCTNYCGLSVYRKDLEEHCRDECPKREVSCEYCGEMDSYEYISGEHIQTCDEYPLLCPLKCNLDEKIKRKDLVQHKEICRLEPIECPFSKAGCKVKLVRHELPDHLEECTQDHLMKVMTSHNAVVTRHNTLEYEHKSLELKHEELESEHKALESEHESLESKHEELESDLKALRSEHKELQSKHKELQSDAAHNELVSKAILSLMESYKSLKSEHNELQSKIRTVGRDVKMLQGPHGTVRNDCIPTFIKYITTTLGDKKLESIGDSLTFRTHGVEYCWKTPSFALSSGHKLYVELCDRSFFEFRSMLLKSMPRERDKFDNFETLREVYKSAKRDCEPPARHDSCVYTTVYTDKNYARVGLGHKLSVTVTLNNKEEECYYFVLCTRYRCRWRDCHREPDAYGRCYFHEWMLSDCAVVTVTLEEHRCS